MPNLKVTISARLFDPHGKLIRKYRPRAAHSFLAQFIELLYVQMAQANTSISRVRGDEFSIPPTGTNFKLNMAASNLNGGLLIGSGTNPVDINDFKLQTPITSDITVTAHTFVLSYPTPSSRRLSISRTFNNTSIAPIQIEEVALYTSYPAATYICLDRTLYSVAIPASSSLELTYRVTVSV